MQIVILFDEIQYFDTNKLIYFNDKLTKKASANVV
jgi:hypothetical protein